MSAGTRLPGTPEPMHFWKGVGGVRIAGDAWGDPNGPLVLLQHGGGQTRHAWKGAGEILGAAGYYAIAFDARGHGDSDWAPDGLYGQDVMVEDLKCVVAALGNRRPVLVGASMGGGPAWSPWVRITSMPPRWSWSISPRASRRRGSTRFRRS